MYLVAIGSLRPRPGGKASLFVLLTLLPLAQARLTRGCVRATVFAADGCFVSMSVWRSPAAMKRFAGSGPHRWALRLAARIAWTERFSHYQAADIPSPDEGCDHWRRARTG